MSRLLTIATVAAGLLITGCGDDDDDSGSAAGTTGAEASAPPSPESTAELASGTGTVIKSSDSGYGTVLFDGKDQAIYLFDKETGPRSECYGDCAAAWPPVLTEGGPQPSGDVDAGLLGTIQRDDGTTQVTYKDQPLYYYAHEGPGQVLCQNVEEFGGLWLVVKPSGEPVEGG